MSTLPEYSKPVADLTASIQSCLRQAARALNKPDGVAESRALMTAAGELQTVLAKLTTALSGSTAEQRRPMTLTERENARGIELGRHIANGNGRAVYS